MDIATACTKTRVILDKGHYLLDENVIVDPTLSKSLDEIRGLLSGVENLIDPRVMAQNSYALSMLIFVSDDESKIGFPSATSLCIGLDEVDHMFDKVLNLPESQTKANTNILSQFEVFMRLSSLKDELENLMKLSSGVSYQKIELSNVASQVEREKLLEEGLTVERAGALSKLSGKGIDVKKVDTSIQQLEEGIDVLRADALNQLLGKDIKEERAVALDIEVESLIKSESSHPPSKEESIINLPRPKRFKSGKGIKAKRKDALNQLGGKVWRVEPLNQLRGKGTYVESADALKEKGMSGKCIVPMGSSLAKVVYDDIEIKNHFELRVWVGLTNALNKIKAEQKNGGPAKKSGISVHVPSSFDGMTTEQKLGDAVYHVMSCHAMGITNNLPAVFGEDFKLLIEETDMEVYDEFMRVYQGIIKNEVFGKKFLLVLDNVSEDHMSQWEDLFAPLSHGSPGSKVIITSRSLHVLEAMKNLDTENIEAVKHGDLFWNFFGSFAFGGLEPNKYPSLHDTGRLIAKQLHRFPLAGRMIGKLLNTNLDEGFWRSVLDDIVMVKEKGVLKNEIYQLILLISLCYNQLPTPLCWCFRYCSIFPKDWIYNSETLIHLWMSQGFISSAADTNQRPEDIGKDYFDCLLSRSFFELFAADGNTSYYVMNKFVHCFGEILSQGESLRLDGSYKPTEAWGVRHLSVTTDNLSFLTEIKGLYNLQTFITFGPFQSEKTNFFTPLLEKQHQLLTLDLTCCGMTNFPELDVPLTHLRYLNLLDTGIETLDSNFAKLTNLQVLNLQGCQLESLPEDTNKLVNLRHIIGPNWLISKIPCIGELTNLQELEEFVVWNEKGHEIGQLGSMNSLGGSLSITQLENVSEESEAPKASLSDKNRLVSLKLEWCTPEENNWIINKSDRVIEGLQPPDSLKLLEITGFDGETFPTWLHTNVLCNISEIRLNNCTKLVELFVLGQLQNLRLLKIERLVSVRRVHFGSNLPSNENVFFPSLVDLCIEDMPQWEVWKEKGDSCFPNLKRLVLRNCPNLRWLPNITHLRLQEMHVEEVGLHRLFVGVSGHFLRVEKDKKSLPSYIKIVGCPLLSWLNITDHSYIKELILENCLEVAYCNFPTILTRLEITGCDLTENFFSRLFWDLRCLSILKIAQCQKMIEFPYLGSLSFSRTLKCLCVEDNYKLALLGGLENLSSLKELCIRRCPQLKIIFYPTFSGLFSLENLCTDSISFFMTEQIVITLESLRVLRIERNLENGQLDRFLCEVPFAERLEQLSLVNCNEITSLPRKIKELAGLKRLYIEGCPRLSSMPDLPSRLEELHVIQCPLLEETCGEDGSDWYKIWHVPDKYFDWE